MLYATSDQKSDSPKKSGSRVPDCATSDGVFPNFNKAGLGANGEPNLNEAGSGLAGVPKFNGARSGADGAPNLSGTGSSPDGVPNFNEADSDDSGTPNFNGAGSGAGLQRSKIWFRPSSRFVLNVE